MTTRRLVSLWACKLRTAPNSPSNRASIVPVGGGERWEPRDSLPSRVAGHPRESPRIPEQAGTV